MKKSFWKRIGLLHKVKLSSRQKDQVNKSDLKTFSTEGLNFYEKNIPFDDVSRPYGGEREIIGISS